MLLLHKVCLFVALLMLVVLVLHICGMSGCVRTGSHCSVDNSSPLHSCGVVWLLFLLESCCLAVLGKTLFVVFCCVIVVVALCVYHLPEGVCLAEVKRQNLGLLTLLLIVMLEL